MGQEVINLRYASWRGQFPVCFFFFLWCLWGGEMEIQIWLMKRIYFYAYQTFSLKLRISQSHWAVKRKFMKTTRLLFWRTTKFYKNTTPFSIQKIYWFKIEYYCEKIYFSFHNWPIFFLSANSDQIYSTSVIEGFQTKCLLGKGQFSTFCPNISF